VLKRHDALSSSKINLQASHLEGHSVELLPNQGFVVPKERYALHARTGKEHHVDGRNRCNRADWRRLSGTTRQAASRSRDPEVGERRLLLRGICNLVSFI
jgi:hypothetical protein